MNDINLHLCRIVFIIIFAKTHLYMNSGTTDQACHTIELCLEIATKAHKGQTDLDGNPVILHPLTVGLMGKNPDEQCAGFLHDVVEDTDFTFDNLIEAGVPEHIVDALRLLTHAEGTDYTDYVRNIVNSGNQLAIAVKLNDLQHNLERGRKNGYTRLVDKHEAALREFEKIAR